MVKFKVLVVFLFIFGCTQKPTEAFLIDKEIMKLHDEAMANAANLLNLKNDINLKSDSALDITLKDSLQGIAFKLKKADKMMLDWMHQYNSPNLKSDTALNYLIKQLVKIKAVHETTFESINEAKTILKK